MNDQTRSAFLTRAARLRAALREFEVDARIGVDTDGHEIVVRVDMVEARRLSERIAEATRPPSDEDMDAMTPHDAPTGDRYVWLDG